MTDVKEFVALLGERREQTKDMVRILGSLEGLGVPNTDTQMKLAITEILTNQMTALNVSMVLVSEIDKIGRRIDAIEKWNQGRLKSNTGAGGQVSRDGRDEMPEVREHGSGGGGTGS